MARYFAQLDENGEVIQVIVAEPEVIAQRPGVWEETWMDGGAKKNYAGIGHKFDRVKGHFHAKKPHASWFLNEDTAQWEAPVKRPAERGEYEWEEDKQKWKKL